MDRIPGQPSIGPLSHGQPTSPSTKPPSTERTSLIGRMLQAVGISHASAAKPSSSPTKLSGLETVVISPKADPATASTTSARTHQVALTSATSPISTPAASSTRKGPERLDARKVSPLDISSTGIASFDSTPRRTQLAAIPLFATQDTLSPTAIVEEGGETSPLSVHEAPVEQARAGAGAGPVRAWEAEPTGAAAPLAERVSLASAFLTTPRRESPAGELITPHRPHIISTPPLMAEEEAAELPGSAGEEILEGTPARRTTGLKTLLGPRSPTPSKTDESLHALAAADTKSTARYAAITEDLHSHFPIMTTEIQRAMANKRKAADRAEAERAEADFIQAYDTEVQAILMATGQLAVAHSDRRDQVEKSVGLAYQMQKERKASKKKETHPFYLFLNSFVNDSGKLASAKVSGIRREWSSETIRFLMAAEDSEDSTPEMKTMLKDLRMYMTEMAVETVDYRASLSSHTNPYHAMSAAPMIGGETYTSVHNPRTLATAEASRQLLTLMETSEGAEAHGMMIADIIPHRLPKRDYSHEPTYLRDMLEEIEPTSMNDFVFAAIRDSAQPTQDFCTAMLYAISRGHTDLVDGLALHSSWKGTTSLHLTDKARIALAVKMAASLEENETTLHLLANAPKEHKSLCLSIAIYEAASSKNTALLRDLLGGKGGPITREVMDGALAIAKKYGKEEEIGRLFHS